VFTNFSHCSTFALYAIRYTLYTYPIQAARFFPPSSTASIASHNATQGKGKGRDRVTLAVAVTVVVVVVSVKMRRS
jgi:hypothetical protein